MKKALARERAKLREMTNADQSHTLLPQLIEGLNRHPKGWANCFAYGHARPAFYQMDSHVRWRLTWHLRRREPTAFPAPAGMTIADQVQRMGLLWLYALLTGRPAHP
ncbi:MAG TPA: group II intron maturase-specific domain-containing protein [Terriglobia bacterium]|nr:group II intron maturase-specific domain-containing protein [Terriglobia bacterium]